MLAEPIAQPLGLADPHLAEARPQRRDNLHLVAMGDDALAQLVQLRAIRIRPAFRERVACGAIAAGQALGHVRESQNVQWPELDRGGGLVKRPDQPHPHVGGQRVGLRCLPQLVDPVTDRGE